MADRHGDETGCEGALADRHGGFAASEGAVAGFQARRSVGGFVGPAGRVVLEWRSGASVDRETKKRLYNACNPDEPLAPDDPRNVDVDALGTPVPAGRPGRRGSPSASSSRTGR